MIRFPRPQLTGAPPLLSGVVRRRRRKEWQTHSRSRVSGVPPPPHRVRRPEANAARVHRLVPALRWGADPLRGHHLSTGPVHLLAGRTEFGWGVGGKDAGLVVPGWVG